MSKAGVYNFPKMSESYGNVKLTSEGLNGVVAFTVIG